jgi:hypothetical protein
MWRGLLTVSGCCTGSGSRYRVPCGDARSASLGDFIDDAELYLPKDIPHADIALVINVHSDLLFALLPRLKDAGVKGVIGGSESPRELPLGQRKQLEELAGSLGMEESHCVCFILLFCFLGGLPLLS